MGDLVIPNVVMLYLFKRNGNQLAQLLSGIIVLRNVKRQINTIPALCWLCRMDRVTLVDRCFPLGHGKGYNRRPGECRMNDGNYVYCPYCGIALEVQEVFNQRRPRCPDCGFIHFRDPKVAVIALVTWHDRLLLIRRGVKPGKGKWALPGGFMDAGEMPESALKRELQEEVGIQVEVQELLGIFPMVGPAGTRGGIVLAFRAVPDSVELPELLSKDDVTEADWFLEHELPNDLAFESTITLLAAWRGSVQQEHDPDKCIG